MTKNTMAEINHPTDSHIHFSRGGKAEQPAKHWTRKWWAILLGTLLLLEMIVPIVLWKLRLPASTDFMTEMVAGAVLLLTFGMMMTQDRIPKGFLFILALTFIWGLVAQFEGQSLAATAWGWTRFFKYPFLALFAFLIPDWPEDFAKWLPKACLWILAFQVGMQVVLLLMGQSPGDSLAGTFGLYGVSKLTIFTFLAVCLALGEWIVTRKWKLTLLVIMLGAVACAMSLTKFYYFAVVLLGLTAVMVYIVRGGKAKSLIGFLLGMSLLVAVVVSIYNWFAATSFGLEPLQKYLQVDAVEEYLFSSGKGYETGEYYLRRGVATSHAWQQLQRDKTTLLFGFGLGSRAYSAALGVAGKSLEGDLLSVNQYVNETGLASLMLESGMVGLLVLLMFNVWVCWRFLSHSRRTEDEALAILECGYVLFTLFLPVWLWYNKAWGFGFAMSLYWIGMGYIFQRISADRRSQVNLSSAGEQGRLAQPARSILSGRDKRPLS